MSKRRSKGDGAIYYDEKRKLYIGQITLGFDEYGKRKRKTVYGHSKTEVKEKIKAVEYQIFEGSFVDVSTITVYHLAKQILDDKLNQGEIKETTYYRNIETLKQLKDIYNTPLQVVNEAQVKDFLLSKTNYSQSSINKVYIMLDSTLKEAVKKHIIAENPIEAEVKANADKGQSINKRRTEKTHVRLG